MTAKEQNLVSKDLLKLINGVPNKNKMKGNSEESRTINTYLDILKSRIYEIQKDLIHSGKDVNGETIKNILLGIDEESECSFLFSKEHNNRMEALLGKEYAKGTLTI